MTTRATTSRTPFLFINGAIALPVRSLVPYFYSDARMLNVVCGDACSPAHLDLTLPSVVDSHRTDVNRETTDDT